MKFNIPNVEPGDTVEIKVTKGEKKAPEEPKIPSLYSHIQMPISDYHSSGPPPWPHYSYMPGPYGWVSGSKHS